MSASAVMTLCGATCEVVAVEELGFGAAGLVGLAATVFGFAAFLEPAELFDRVRSAYETLLSGFTILVGDEWVSG